MSSLSIAKILSLGILAILLFGLYTFLPEKLQNKLGLLVLICGGYLMYYYIDWYYVHVLVDRYIWPLIP